jgi:hypothetical protein
MLVHHLRDQDGHLQYHDGRPVTVTVSASWAPRSRIPEGPRYRMHRDKAPSVAPSSAELEAVIDHVHAWSGITYGGTPEPCTRNAVRISLLTQPSFLAEVRRAIKIAGSSGVLI